MKAFLFAIGFVLLVGCCAVFAADDGDGIVGGYPNNADGITFLLEDAGPCTPGMRMAVARNANGLMVGAGCYAIHNAQTVVILWVRGPATVVPVSRVTWKESAPTTPQAAPAGPTS